VASCRTCSLISDSASSIIRCFGLLNEQEKTGDAHVERARALRLGDVTEPGQPRARRVNNCACVSRARVPKHLSDRSDACRTRSGIPGATPRSGATAEYRDAVCATTRRVGSDLTSRCERGQRNEYCHATARYARDLPIQTSLQRERTGAR
jgi:hypothetical protein